MSSHSPTLSSSTQCAILNEQLPLALADQAPRVQDKTVSIDEAERQAKTLVASDKRNVFIVQRSSIGQAKAIAQSGLAVRVETTASQISLQQAIARCGTITATLGDVKQHADVLVLIGDSQETTPRLNQLIDASNKAVHHDKNPNANSVADFAHAVRQGNHLAGDKYVAIIVAPDAFDRGQAGPAIELLVETVIWMNNAKRAKPQRAVLLSLDPLASLRSTMAWNTNKRLQPATPFDFESGTTIRMGCPQPHQHRADIQIGGADRGRKLASIFLPASTPGIHHTDAVVRGDGTVTLPLAKIADANFPTTDQWIARLLRQS